MIDARGDTRAATLGNILATRIVQRGAAGIVTDGAFRDTPAIATLDLPTYAAGQSPDVSTAIHHPQDINVPIGCGGVAVLPGDVLVGDGEGVVVIPRAVAESVIRPPTSRSSARSSSCRRSRKAAASSACTRRTSRRYVSSKPGKPHAGAAN